MAISLTYHMSASLWLQLERVHVTSRYCDVVGVAALQRCNKWCLARRPNFERSPRPTLWLSRSGVCSFSRGLNGFPCAVLCCCGSFGHVFVNTDHQTP
eukprot:3745671-Amphidinium_carterae.1